jgi:hypothetical protein
VHERDYLDRVVRGGYPEAIRRSPRRCAAFSITEILLEAVRAVPTGLG